VPDDRRVEVTEVTWASGDQTAERARRLLLLLFGSASASEREDDGRVGQARDRERSGSESGEAA
jgi:hypothetical protein